MNKKGWMMLRILINHYNPKAGNALLRFLPPSEAQQVMNQDIRSTDIMPILHQPQRLIEKMHYSWLQPIIEQLPEPLRPLAVAALTPRQAIYLQKYANPHFTLSAPIKTFFIHRIYHSLHAHDHLPLEYLPETELSSLVNWNKQRLVVLSDFLGLHDLASEIRHIVDRNQLRHFYDCLNSHQLAYLKICLHQKERIISPKLGIRPTKQDCAQLKQILHRRGLIRLAKALCGQHPDLAWYIAHTLDRGRGKILLQNYQTQVIPEITTVLKQQVTNLMNFLKNE